jgi:hypothetical protein
VLNKQGAQAVVLKNYSACDALHLEGCLNPMLFVLSQAPLQVLDEFPPAGAGSPLVITELDLDRRRLVL